MNLCPIVLVLLIVVVLLAAYSQRHRLVSLWGAHRPVVVALGGDEFQDNYQDDVYGNFDDNMYGGGPFRLKISDPEYTALLENKKTIEARLDRPPFNRIKVGDTVTVVRARPKDDLSEYPGGRYKHNSTVVRVTKYANLEALLKAEGVAKTYPGKTMAEAAGRFSVYLPPGTSPSDPVLAIELKIMKDSKK